MEDVLFCSKTGTIVVGSACLWKIVLWSEATPQSCCCWWCSVASRRVRRSSFLLHWICRQLQYTMYHRHRKIDSQYAKYGELKYEFCVFVVVVVGQSNCPTIFICPTMCGFQICLLYTSPSPRDRQKSRMPSSA